MPKRKSPVEILAGIGMDATTEELARMIDMLKAIQAKRFPKVRKHKEMPLLQEVKRSESNS